MMECAHGHTTRRISCVSCVLLHDCQSCGHARHRDATCNQYGCECPENYKPDFDTHRDPGDETRPYGRVWLVTGFGIPGDDAWVEAPDGEAAKRLLHEKLTQQGLESGTDPNTWEVLEVYSPLFVIRWAT